MEVTQMAGERTLCIIKPDAVERRAQGAIIGRIMEEGFEILAMRQLVLSRRQVETFYEVHRGRPFFQELCRFMGRGPIVVIALQRENAVQHWRSVIGATDPARAEPGTIRKLVGSNVAQNAVHGSDSVDNGVRECAYFFAGIDLT